MISEATLDLAPSCQYAKRPWSKSPFFCGSKEILMAHFGMYKKSQQIQHRPSLISQSASLLSIVLLMFSNSARLPAQTDLRGNVDIRRLPIDTLPENLISESPPLGFAKLPYAADSLDVLKDSSPMSLDMNRVILGRRLFFDGRLSEDGTVSCATCHQPRHGFASPDPIAIGIKDRIGKRNAPTLLNRGWGKSFFWDGRAISLEEQSLLPISNPDEMGTDLDLIVRRLSQVREYQQLFRQAFDLEQTAAGDFASDDPLSLDATSAVTADRIGKALADFQRTLILGNSEIDRFRASTFSEISLEARQGLWLFESRGRCWQCHSGENFTDEDFHNTGVGFGQPNRDLGRFEVTGVDRDRFRFKTPTLRGVEQTPPYMHDGSMATLEEVVEFYSKGGASDDPELDPLMKPLNLSEDEKRYLVEFLKALSR